MKYLKNKKIIALSLSTMMILAGCGAQYNANTNEVQNTNVDIVSTSATSENNSETAENATEEISDILLQKVEYNEEDEYTEWANTTYTSVNFSGKNATINGDGTKLENGVLNITQGGTYVLNGKFEGSILVNTAKTDNVRIVLNGVEIISNTTAPIQVYQANKVVISLEENTTNTLTDAVLSVLSKNKDGDEITATIYSKEDIIINGKGTLNINANTKDGITSKDDLMIIDGTINITATDDALVGKDSVQVKSGSINITAKGDGIKASNDIDQGEGYVVINGGNIKISSGDDAIKGEQQVIINGGEIDVIESVEGIESIELIFAGGNVKVKSSDDGLNATGVANNSITVYGGNIFVDSKGDGIDSNGTIKMSGGNLTVSGPTNDGNGSLDYDQSFDITGGVLSISGSAGMAQATSSTSTQNTISYSFASNQNAGTKIELKDKNGNTVASITPTKTFRNVIFSNDQIKTGETYTLFVNNQEETSFTVESVVSYFDINGESQVRGGFAHGQRPSGMTPPSRGNGQTPPEPPQ